MVLRFTRREQILLIALLVAVLLSVGIYVSQKPSQESAVPFQKTEPTEQEKSTSEKKSGTQLSIKVDVKGSVHRPGVVSLPADSRVADAIAAAGGALENANLEKLNMAAKLVDGGQVLVPGPEQKEGSGTVSKPSGVTSEGKVDLNHASEGELDRLPGIGASRVKAIIDYRETQGPFQSVDDLKKVKGFGDKLVDSLRDKVVVQ